MSSSLAATAAAHDAGPTHLRLLYKTGPQTDESCLVASAGDILVRLSTTGEWHLVMHIKDQDRENAPTGYVPCTYVEEYQLTDVDSSADERSVNSAASREEDSTSEAESVDVSASTGSPKSAARPSTAAVGLDIAKRAQKEESTVETTAPTEVKAKEKSKKKVRKRHQKAAGATKQETHAAAVLKLAVSASLKKKNRKKEQKSELSLATAQLAAAIAKARERRTIVSYFGLQTAIRAAVVAGMAASAPEAAAARALVHELQHGNADLTGGQRYCIDFSNVLSDTGTTLVYAATDQRLDEPVTVKFCPRTDGFTREAHRFVAKQLAARLKRKRGKTVAYADGAVNIRELLDAKTLGPFPKALRREMLLQPPDRCRLSQAIVMDFAAGGSLQNLLASTTFAGRQFGRSMKIFFSVAQALYKLHASRRVHGQVSPRKVLRIRQDHLGSDSVLKLGTQRKSLTSRDAVAERNSIDGSSKEYKHEHDSATGYDDGADQRFVFKLCGLSAQTKFGHPFVHPRAAVQTHDAPEVVRLWASRQTTNQDGEPPETLLCAHPSQDIWALGCLLYQLGTGRPLFRPAGFGSNDLEDETDIVRLCTWTKLDRSASSLFFRSELGAGGVGSCAGRPPCCSESDRQEVLRLVRACLQGSASARPDIRAILLSPLAARFLPASFVDLIAVKPTDTPDLVSAPVRASCDTHFFISRPSSACRPYANSLGVALQELGCSVWKHTASQDSHAGAEIADIGLRPLQARVGVAESDIFVLFLPAGASHRGLSRAACVSEVLWAYFLNKTIVVVAEDRQAFVNFELDLYERVTQLEPAQLVWQTTTTPTAGNPNPSNGSDEGPVALAKRVLRFLKERADSSPPLLAGTCPVQVVAENVLRRASLLADWGYLPLFQVSHLRAQVIPDNSLSEQTEISISFLHDGSSAADAAFKGFERLASALQSIIETNGKDAENHGDHVAVGAVDVVVTPLRIVGNDNGSDSLKLSRAQNIVVVLHDDLILSAALVALAKSYFAGEVSKQRIQIVLPVPKLPDGAAQGRQKDHCRRLECDAAVNEAIKRLVDAKADAGVVRLIGDIGRVHLMAEEASDPSRVVAVVAHDDDARDYELVQWLRFLFPSAKGALLPASRKSAKMPLVLPADRTHAIGAAQVNEGEEKTRPIDEGFEDKTAPEVRASTPAHAGGTSKQDAASDASDSKLIKPPPPPAKKKTATSTATEGDEREVKPPPTTSEALPAVPARKKKAHSAAGANTQRGDSSTKPAAPPSCESSQSSTFVPKPSAAFFQVIEKHISKLKRPEEFQYLHMRTALRVTVGRPTLSPFEKAALKYRLMQFTPQAVQRFEAFFMRNAAFEQEGIFRIAPSQDLLQGALATMELCSSRARVLGDDAAVDTFPEFLDMQIPLAVGRERELLINVVASCYKYYFRRMSIPLITSDVYTSMRSLASESNMGREEFLAGLPQALVSLPPPHRVLLRHTLRVLQRVTECGDVNRMSTDAVARIFSAGVLPVAELDSTRSLSDMQDDNDKQIWMLKILIDAQSKVFVEMDILIAAQLAENPNVRLTNDDSISECCHDANRWRFFFPEDPAASIAASVPWTNKSKKSIFQQKLAANDQRKAIASQFDEFLAKVRAKIAQVESATP